MILHFALETNAAQLQPGDVEEANIRLMIIHSSALAVKPNKKKQKSKNRSCGNSVEKSGKDHANATAANDKQKHRLNLKVFQRLGNGKRVCLDSSKLTIEIDQSRKYDTHSQWVQFDVTKAVETWLREERSNLGLEVQCDNCQRVGARILNDISSPTNVDDADADGAQLMPILNIIGHLGVSYKEIRSNKHSNSVEKRHHYHNVATFSNGQQGLSGAIDKLSCHKFNQRCCRHTMEVIFKEIKGFEFIIQPKVFDAGYCHGRCPPRYNPAHHHAMLQSLIWKQNRERVPRPCCAPSKLVELEVLHVDEKDSEKLKISTWTDMRVVECACS
ncbi:bone morphogenetic protein 4 [Bactrocera tryoni]|nr:bone morphogenetic protein 4 [Bactrocera tryoni]XP_039967887.1 bone morphogenetic protein 4 [Bactrocera tryoni]XP_039967888.1 bone morphogenetic protein 4 [Bactrocera tryoni]